MCSCNFLACGVSFSTFAILAHIVWLCSRRTIITNFLLLRYEDGATVEREQYYNRRENTNFHFAS